MDLLRIFDWPEVCLYAASLPLIGEDRPMNPRILAVSALALLSAHAASATTYFDTVTGTSSGGTDGANDGVTVIENSFTASTPNFTLIQLLLSAASPGDGGAAQVYLVPDDGSGGAAGVAGNPTQTFASGSAGSQLLGTVTDSSLSTTPSLTALSVSSPIATLDDEYWVAVVLNGASSLQWTYNTDDSGVGTAGQAYYNNLPGQIGVFQDSVSPPYAMIVATPEPGTLAILGVGLAGIGFIPRRQAR